MKMKVLISRGLGEDWERERERESCDEERESCDEDVICDVGFEYYLRVELRKTMRPACFF